jgi:hypothetical protein
MRNEESGFNVEGLGATCRVNAGDGKSIHPAPNLLKRIRHASVSVSDEDADGLGPEGL